MFNNNYPKVSIMIPVYNQEKYIEQNIESALDQDYPNLEVVVSDDCSIDNTQKLIEKFRKDSRLKYFRNKRNIGKTANHTKLLCDYARGEWVLMLDGDDYLINNHFIKTAIGEMIKHKNVVMIIGGLRIIYPDKEYDLIPSRTIKLKNGFDIFLDFFRITPAHGSTIYKRELGVKLGYRLGLHDDFDLFLRMLLHGNVILLNRISYVWRHHEKNISDSIPATEYLMTSNYIDEAYKYALNLNYKKNQLNNWKKQMYSWFYYSYLSNRVRALKRGLISKREVDKDIATMIKYILKNKKYFSLLDLNLFSRIVIYKFCGPGNYELIADSFKKIKIRNRFKLLKS